jgi:hypothetical protein
MDRVAIRGSERDVLRGDVPPAPGPVLDDDRLSDVLESFLRDDPCGVSVPPPGANPTVSVTLRAGNGCACALRGEPRGRQRSARLEA